MDLREQMAIKTPTKVEFTRNLRRGDRLSIEEPLKLLEELPT